MAWLMATLVDKCTCTNSTVSIFTVKCKDETKRSNNFEDTKGIIRIRKSQKDRQFNGQTKRDKTTTNDVQNTTHKTKDPATRSPLNLWCSGRDSSSCSMCAIRSVSVHLSIGNKTYNILLEHIYVVDYSNSIKQNYFYCVTLHPCGWSYSWLSIMFKTM